jgi:hypothetical protein
VVVERAFGDSGMAGGVLDRRAGIPLGGEQLTCSRHDQFPRGFGLKFAESLDQHRGYRLTDGR